MPGGLRRIRLLRLKLRLYRRVIRSKPFAEFSNYGKVEAAGYADLKQDAFDVVINATSASLRAELPDLRPEAFRPGCLAYELSYGKGLAPFLGLAQSSGAGKLADGVGMLVEQAAEAFAWWRGRRPLTRDVIEAITVPLV